MGIHVMQEYKLKEKATLSFLLLCNAHLWLSVANLHHIFSGTKTHMTPSFMVYGGVGLVPKSKHFNNSMDKCKGHGRPRKTHTLNLLVTLGSIECRFSNWNNTGDNSTIEGSLSRDASTHHGCCHTAGVLSRP